MRVLLAEDHPINTVVAVKMLQKMGCVVEHAANGRIALARVQESSFDAVLMDVHMPEMDGVECARAIRSAEAPGDHLPIIALTASAMVGDDAICIAAGMDSYLPKPLNAAKLRDELLRARGARGADRAEPSPEAVRPA
jgi:CheY-like chemotaxis protein